MAKKNITIDDLAVMVQKGFNETAKKVDMDLRFDKLDTRLSRVEKDVVTIRDLILESHRKKIEKLEEDVKDLKGLLAV